MSLTACRECCTEGNPDHKCTMQAGPQSFPHAHRSRIVFYLLEARYLLLLPCLSPTRVACSLEKEAFITECACLAKNTECGKSCGCISSGKRCMNSAIQRREALRLSADIQEVDTWGMDCYTRRNIHDGKPPSNTFASHLMCSVVTQAPVERALPIHKLPHAGCQ